MAFSAAAHAAPPANVTGSWTLLTDTVYTTLDITSQGASGAPGASGCRMIDGTLAGVAPIRGYYCPKSGRIHFLHNNLFTNATVRMFTGNVSQEASGVMHMAGTFDVLASVFGELREYPFAAEK